MSVSFTAGIYGFELKFTYSATTTSPAGAGELRFNNASPGSATAIYIDAEDRNSVDVSAIVAALNTNSSLLVIDENDPAVWALFTLGSVTDNTTNLTLAVTAIEAIGSFSGNISLCVAPKGATGSTGSVSAATVLQRLVERGDRDRQRQTDQAQSIKATEYIGNGYVRQIGQAPTQSRYLGNAGLIPGELVAPIGRGQAPTQSRYLGNAGLIPGELVAPIGRGQAPTQSRYLGNAGLVPGKLVAPIGRGQAPTRSRYLGNAGLIPGKLVAPIGRGQQYVIIHKKPVPFFTPETIEEDPIRLFNTFKMTIVTDGANQDYTVNIASGTGPNITIDWGDGVTETFITTGQKTHTYNSAGTYTAKLWGEFTNNGNLRFGSNASNRNRLKAVSEFPLIKGLISFVLSFESCSGLTEIPADLFRYNPSVISFFRCFRNCTGLTGNIPADLFRYNVLATSFYACLESCSGLTGSIPADLFRYNILATDMGLCLNACTGLTGNIPADLFRYNVLVNNFRACLQSCSGLTGSIPADLFRYNILATNMAFCLSACTGLTGNIPADLFRYNVLATSFYACLEICSGLTGSIPAELFRYNILATDMGFCLNACTGLTGNIPADLFRYNVLVNNFRACLQSCSGLTGSIPADLFRYNTLVEEFSYCLLNCSGLRFSSDIFSPSSEYSTRFAGKHVNFSYAFQLIGSTGGIGVAPALWLYTFGSVNRTGCFRAVSVSTATNYADIPATWK